MNVPRRSSRALVATSLALPLFISSISTFADAPALAFQHVRVFDGVAVAPDMTVVVRGGKIDSLGRNLVPPAHATIVDGRGTTLLPGFIDAHVHVWESQQLRQAIALGVTSELDMMTMPGVAAALKRRAQSDPNMADLRSAGNPVTAPGGHGTEYGFPMATITTPAEATAFVRARASEGSDYLKIMYTPGSTRYPSIDRSTLLACVREARARGLLTVAHIETLAGALEAIGAGVNALAHLFGDRMPDSSFGATVARSGALVIPTLSVLEGADESARLATDPSFAPFMSLDAERTMRAPRRRPAEADVDKVVRESVRQLLAAGVPVLAGTDAPNPGTAHGISLHGELELLVRSGLTPTQALAAATAVPASTFGLTDRGRIAPGLRADLVLVRGDPTRDIRATRAIVGVWRGGVAVDRDAFRRRVSEERLARARLAAQPPGSTAAKGVVSDFEEGAPSARLGRGWTTSSDRLAGGASIANMSVVEGGAHGSKGALLVTGEAIPGGSITWSGVSLSVSPALDLSAAHAIAFWAKGDSRAFSVLVFSAGRQIPAHTTFQPSGRWQRYVLPLSSFQGVQLDRVTAIFVGSTTPGRFSIQLDDFALE